MAVKLSGLASGLDTESIIKELMSVQSYKKTKVENKKTKLEWKEEKWKDLNTKLMSLYKNELSKLKSQSSYMTKKVSSSDTSSATFSATINVPTGNHTVSISSVASSQYVTGTELANDKITTASYLTYLGVGVGTIFTLNTDVLDGTDSKTSTFKVSFDTTVKDMANWCKENGVTLNYDTNNKRFFISSTDSGEENSFTLSSATASSATSQALSDLYDAIGGYGNISAQDQTAIDDALYTIVNEDPSSGNYASALETLQQYATANQAAYNATVNSSTYQSEHQQHLESLFYRMESGLEDKIEVTYDLDNNKYVASVKADYDGEEVTADELQDYQNMLDSLIDVASIETISENDLYKSTYGSTLQNIKDGNTAIDTTVAADMVTYASVYHNSFNTGGTSALETMGIGELSVVAGKVNSSLGAAVTVMNSSDCVISYNGAVFTNSSNTITVNGLTINAVSKTDSPMSVNVTNDNDAVYNVVKNFVKAYNEILTEMNDLYYADSASKYDVLTSEEKEAMSDDEVEKWEGKIKGALLRRDSTLGSLLTSLKSITSDSVTVDGKNYALSSFGIGTLDYTEKGLLHIDGDADDADTSDLTNKLMNMINSDPETVMNVLNGIGSKLYSTLQEKMGKTALSSSQTFYNDVEITSLKKQYDDEIVDWQDFLDDLEDKYYKKFSAMETAMSKLNSQTSYISQMFSF